MAPIIFSPTIIEITVQIIKIEGEFETVLNSLKKREEERGKRYIERDRERYI